jgi:hypothetical protein
MNSAVSTIHLGKFLEIAEKVTMERFNTVDLTKGDLEGQIQTLDETILWIDLKLMILDSGSIWSLWSTSWVYVEMYLAKEWHIQIQVGFLNARSSIGECSENNTRV